MIKSINKTILFIGIITFTSSFLINCVYFNTFYNAKFFFSEAEKLRIEKEGELLGNNIINKYKKVIEKSDIVINNYPKSKYLDDALFLKGRSHYYREEYELSESTFHTLVSTNPDDYLILSEYWLALNKWKSGKPQPALNDLNQAISQTDNKALLAQIYQSQAEIFLELNQDSIAVTVLEKAAELTKTRQDKGKIYYRLAELAYEIQSYERAIDHYKNVIKYSYSNERVMDANLKIVQRYRDLNDLEKASEEIKTMLIDPEFSTIHDDLKLELAKLRLSQKNKEDAVSILENIVMKYPKTETSAEAFYMLGEQSLLNDRDFVKADYYYKQIRREFSKSVYNDRGKQRIKEIDNYTKSKEYFNKIEIKNIEKDSLTVKHVIDTSKVVLELYNLGELEAFHFNQTDTAMIYFNRIITDFPESDLDAKAIFALSHLLEQIGDSIKSIKYKEKIINNYPDSEYANNIRLNTKQNYFGVSGFALLTNAEQLYAVNSDSALIEYKRIANLSNSETAQRALFFIANEYDYQLMDPDSAYKYYYQIANRFPESEQADISKERLKYLNYTQTDSTDSSIE